MIFGASITDNNIGDVWDSAMGMVLGPAGIDKMDERDRLTREVIGLSLTVLNPAVPMPNRIFGAASPFWQDKTKMMEYVKKEWLRGDNPDGHSYTYGQLLKPQISGIVDKLKKFPGTRRAYALLVCGGEELPCLTKLQYLIADDQLITIADFRSLDVAGAYPADFAGLYAMAKNVSYVLSCTPSPVETNVGPIVCHVGSAHFYWGEVRGWGYGPSP